MNNRRADDPHTLIAQLETRLACETRRRQEAERLASRADGLFKRERKKLLAAADIANSEENDQRLHTAGRIALAALLEQTHWHDCRLYFFPFEVQASPSTLAARLEAQSCHYEQDIALTPSALEWLDSSKPLQLYRDRWQAPQLHWPRQMPSRCLYTVGVNGECFGGFELFSDQEEGKDPTFTHELLHSLARELAHVYKSERDRQSMEDMAYRDVLTGLGNRAAFFRDLEGLTARHQRLALLYIDLDGFREINNECGHDVGDIYLCRIAMRLRDEPGLLSQARLGSDEFVVLLSPDDADRSAIDLAGALLDRLRAPVVIEEHFIEPGISAGLAVYPEDAGCARTLFNAADLAIHRAHESGGNTLRRYDAAIASLTRKRKRLAQRVRQAVNGNEFEPWFQPIMTADRRIAGVEALLRWTAPESPGPADFVPVMERQGLMRSVGLQTLQRVMQQAVRWREAGLKLEHISVNVSPVQLREAAFVDHIDALLAHTGLPASCLVLEITESLYISAEKTVLERLARLRGLGVRLALDDFGTGYSSLSYLQWMPLDMIKIDKSFVSRLNGEPARRDLTIVRSIIRIARACGLTVVAEGVETEVVARRLTALGVQYLQGYHFGRPTGADRIHAMFSLPASS